jgi:hypothetical protein
MHQVKIMHADYICDPLCVSRDISDHHQTQPCRRATRVPTKGHRKGAPNLSSVYCLLYLKRAVLACYMHVYTSHT